MAGINLSALEFFLPILSFLIVFVVTFVVLSITKVLGENKFIQVFISFMIATIFVSVASANKFVLTITPWFAVFIVVLAFVLVMLKFVGKEVDFLHKGVGVVLVVGLLIIFLFSAFYVFSPKITPYLPGGSAAEGNTFTNWLYSPKVYGALLLLGISALVGWILTKK